MFPEYTVANAVIFTLLLVIAIMVMNRRFENEAAANAPADNEGNDDGIVLRFADEGEYNDHIREEAARLEAEAGEIVHRFDNKEQADRWLWSASKKKVWGAYANGLSDGLMFGRMGFTVDEGASTASKKHLVHKYPEGTVEFLARWNADPKCVDGLEIWKAKKRNRQQQPAQTPQPAQPQPAQNSNGNGRMPTGVASDGTVFYD